MRIVLRGRIHGAGDADAVLVDGDTITWVGRGKPPHRPDEEVVALPGDMIAPGFIETAMTVGLGDEPRRALETRIALRRLGTVDDVAYAAVFLASEQAGYITGTVLNVSGGLYT